MFFWLGSTGGRGRCCCMCVCQVREKEEEEEDATTKNLLSHSLSLIIRADCEHRRGGGEWEAWKWNPMDQGGSFVSHVEFRKKGDVNGFCRKKEARQCFVLLYIYCSLY